MKLIYAKGSCALSVHILLEELGVKYETQAVSLKDKTVLEQYNPKSYVPALVLDDGQVLTEAANILVYLADFEQDIRFLPKAGTLERARCVEWLTYVSTELHKGCGPLFHRDKAGREFLAETIAKLEKRLAFMDTHLQKNKFLMGEDYSIADMYTLAILRILEHVKVKLEKFPAIVKYKKMLESMTIINKVLREEESAIVSEKAA